MLVMELNYRYERYSSVSFFVIHALEWQYKYNKQLSILLMSITDK